MKTDEYGEGTITPLEDKPRSRCRRWMICVWVDGKRHRHRFHGTYTQAVDERSRFATSLVAMEPESETKPMMTFGEYADEWVALRESGHELASTTLYKSRRVAGMLSGLFGDIPLDALDPLTIRRGLDGLRNGGAPSGEELSGTYMNTIYITLKSILESAVADEVIDRNPCARMKAPRRDTGEREALPLDVLTRFLATLDAQPLDSHTMALRLAVLAGLRRGETVGVRWGDIDGDTVHIRRAITDCGEVKCTKSPAGIRDVPLLASVVTDLARWSVVQRERCDLLGVEQTDDMYVCCSSMCGVMSPQNLDRWWRQNRGPLYGLDGVVLHQLRHTYLTQLAHSGADLRALQSLAGWASMSMADTYVHDDSAANRAAVDALAKRLGEA